jgi:hypothetical protein
MGHLKKSSNGFANADVSAGSAGWPLTRFGIGGTFRDLRKLLPGRAVSQKQPGTIARFTLCLRRHGAFPTKRLLAK